MSMTWKPAFIILMGALAFFAFKALYMPQRANAEVLTCASGEGVAAININLDQTAKKHGIEIEAYLWTWEKDDKEQAVVVFRSDYPDNAMVINLSHGCVAPAAGEPFNGKVYIVVEKEKVSPLLVGAELVFSTGKDLRPSF
jgi:hypothetical protein